MTANVFTSIERVRLWLDEVFASGRDWNSKTMMVIDELSSCNRLQDVLRLTISDYETLSWCAAQSYKHKNGFDKFVLVSSPVHGYKVRLHAWWPTTRGQGTENIHNHRWDFASKILTGDYTFQQFTPSNEGDVYRRYRYASPDGSTQYKLEYEKDEALEKVFEHRVTAGGSYFLGDNLLHRVISRRDQLTISIACQGPVKKDHTSVYTLSLIKDDSYLLASRFSESELRIKLNECVGVLDQR